MTTPPFVSGGLPVLGNIVEFMRNKMQLIERGYQEHGEIFSFKMANQNMVMLLGPENSEIFFKETDKSLGQKEVMGYLEPVIGSVGALAGHESYLEDRKNVAPLLGGRYMKAHAQAMVTETQIAIEELGDSGTFDINEFSQRISMRIAARALLGDEFRQLVGEEFIHQYHNMADGIETVLPPEIPLPKYRKRDKAKHELDLMIGELVDERRASADDYDDFFQHLVTIWDDDGNLFDRQRVINLVHLMVFAGFDTTSAHLAWGIAYLLDKPDYLAIVQQEIDAVFEQHDHLQLEYLKEMPHLNYAMMEVERYRPAVEVLPRFVREDLHIGDYTIPSGWTVMISPEYSHKLERIFTEPETFDPTRFNDERCEHAQHANSLTGFGGGIHKCWGMKFAYNEMATIIAMLLHEYELSLVNPPLEGKLMTGIIRPVNDIRYHRR